MKSADIRWLIALAVHFGEDKYKRKGVVVTELQRLYRKCESAQQESASFKVQTAWGEEIEREKDGKS